MNHTVRSLMAFRKDMEPRLEQLRHLLLLLFVAFLPFPMQYSTTVLFAAGVVSLLSLNKEKLRSIPGQLWIFQLVFFISVAGYFYSTDLYRAGYLIERQLAILIFPVLLPLSVSITAARVRQLLGALTLSCCGTLLYLFYETFHRIAQLKLPLKAMFSADFLNHRFSAPVGIHAGYLSLYVALSIIFLLDVIVKAPRAAFKWLTLTPLLFLGCGMFFLAARNIMISTAIVACVLYPLFYIRHKLLFFSAGIIIIVIILAGLSRSVYFRDRFYSEMMYDISVNKSIPNSEDQAEPRMKRWRCAMELVAQRPVFGYGTGDEVLLLKQAYLKHGLMVSYKLNFNAHNEYISYLIRNGIAGLLLFLAMLAYFVYLSVQGKDFIYCSFLFVLITGMFTENILAANKGIFFFAFFNTLMGYRILEIRKQKKV